jgi:hypothetical protein
VRRESSLGRPNVRSTGEVGRPVSCSGSDRTFGGPSRSSVATLTCVVGSLSLSDRQSTYLLAESRAACRKNSPLGIQDLRGSLHSGSPKIQCNLHCFLLGNFPLPDGRGFESDELVDSKDQDPAIRGFRAQ